jgi:4-hydroxy-4-methyl-2-oxoglutarate aldolase
MIGEPVALTIRRKIERPPARTLRAYAGLPTGFVTDAYNGRGCLDYRIKPLTPDMKLCGPAITAFCSPGDILAAMAILDFAKKGDVIVIAAGAETNAAKIGDLWLHWAKRIGVAGILCDGLVRDVVGLLKADLPVFARGIAPNAGYKSGPGAINAEVSCGGVAIAPGDVIVGDRDGVVAIPRAQAAVVAKQLELVKKKEAAAELSIRRGVKLQFWDEQALGERVRYVD